MSQSSKQPMSGLRSVKRDFSSNAIPPSSSSTNAKSEDAKSLSAQDRRFKMIQEALAGHTPSDNIFKAPGNSLSEGISKNKRSSSSQEEPETKRRRMPSAWKSAAESSSATQATSSSGSQKSLSSVPSSSRANIVSSSVVTPSSSSSSGNKVAAVFLSQEQTHILKLVESGQSLFYTGSAGKSTLLISRSDC